MEDNVLVVVFPSTFSLNKIKPLISNIKKILKIENQKFHKIRQEGDIIIVETDDPVFTSSTINTLFGIEKVDGNTTTKTLSSNTDPKHVCNFRIVINSS